MRTLWRVLIPAAVVVAATVGGAYRGVANSPSTPAAPVPSTVPTTTIKRGDLTLTVTARGDLQGGSSEMLSAPMTGEAQMVSTYLRAPGEVVAAGDVVAQLDTTEQGYRLKEAE